MMARQTILRSAALVTLIAGIGTFAAQSSLFDRQGSVETDLTNITLTAATPDTAPGPLQLPIVSDSAGVRLPDQAGERPSSAVSELGLPCGLTVSAIAMPAAIAALDIMDPCQPNTRVEIEHSDLRITAQTDALGLLTLDVPAFETPAFFTVSLPDGQTGTVLVGLPDLETYARVAVSWSGDRQLELHALELGADFGGPGHVWENAPGTPTYAVTGQGGFLFELGDAALENAGLSQIYTFPRATLGQFDQVRFSVDMPILDVNCGQVVEANTLQMQANGSVQVTPIRLTVPGCDAVGDYLVLQNVFEDLRLASN